MQNPGQGYEWLEFFAGQGNLTRTMAMTQYKAVRFDLIDHDKEAHRRSNFMDLTDPSGFAFLGFLKIRCKIWTTTIGFDMNC